MDDLNAFNKIREYILSGETRKARAIAVKEKMTIEQLTEINNYATEQWLVFYDTEQEKHDVILPIQDTTTLKQIAYKE